MEAQLLLRLRRAQTMMIVRFERGRFWCCQVMSHSLVCTNCLVEQRFPTKGFLMAPRGICSVCVNRSPDHRRTSAAL